MAPGVRISHFRSGVGAAADGLLAAFGVAVAAAATGDDGAGWAAAGPAGFSAGFSAGFDAGWPAGGEVGGGSAAVGGAGADVGGGGGLVGAAGAPPPHASTSAVKRIRAARRIAGTASLPCRNRAARGQQFRCY